MFCQSSLRKLASRSKVSVHMGYFEIRKGYILLDLSSQTLFVSRDVIFKEDVFSFSSHLSKKHSGSFVNNGNIELLQYNTNLTIDRNVSSTRRPLDLITDLTVGQEEIAQQLDKLNNKDMSDRVK